MSIVADHLCKAYGHFAALDDVSGEPLRYPHWHQANTSSDRLSPADLSLIGRHLS